MLLGFESVEQFIDWIEAQSAESVSAALAPLLGGLFAQDALLRGGFGGGAAMSGAMPGGPCAGVPTPNIFTGMQNIHGPLEWVSLQDMAKSVEVCVAIARGWAVG